MGKPYSTDLRERVVSAVEAGQSRRAAAEIFGISASCAVKLVRRWRETGSVQPGKIGAPRPWRPGAQRQRPAPQKPAQSRQRSPR